VREDRNAVSGSGRARRLECRARKIRDDAASSQAAYGRQFLDCLEDVVVDIKGGAHGPSITHRTSDVNITVT
jgi:hypothetical protein